MKKYLRLCLTACAILVLAFTMTACSGTNSDSSSDSDDAGTSEPAPGSSEVKDVDFGSSQTHEELMVLDFEPDENIDSVYYKRATNPENNEASYLVKYSSDGEEHYLPLAKTVCYVDETLGDRAYVERVPLSYTIDGEPVETFQYQIYTSAFAVGDDGSRYAEAQNHESSDVNQDQIPENLTAADMAR